MRQFDEKAPGRRWFKKLQKQNRWRRFVSNMQTDGDLTGWLTNLFWVILVLSALVFGYIWGGVTQAPAPTDPKDKPPAKTEPAKPQP